MGGWSLTGEGDQQGTEGMGTGRVAAHGVENPVVNRRFAFSLAGGDRVDDGSVLVDGFSIAGNPVRALLDQVCVFSKQPGDKDAVLPGGKGLGAESRQQRVFFRGLSGFLVFAEQKLADRGMACLFQQFEDALAAGLILGVVVEANEDGACLF